ncbi:hypothetical protein BIFCAT_00044 [Bifidobacterium catenulatum DSM 16992 = JCM 1194 = LMG 11043]|uniref:Uncharacterized protein n=1 Tax=Bifidobacterium catenulatum DSM 16992 = JCM 1194 = LMG 11043 TaxID=566552 RepID=B6XSI7_9BIFI|nr:hypothetical protein BIFCAT_00044 [Bifidobacterium catenulatum DSM 16992 = JCM 1194 = LMG 11043]
MQAALLRLSSLPLLAAINSPQGCSSITCDARDAIAARCH